LIPNKYVNYALHTNLLINHTLYLALFSIIITLTTLFLPITNTLSYVTYVSTSLA
jgi:hypothetical protein